MMCPDPEESIEEYCDCECRKAWNYWSCYEECMLDYDYDYEDEE